ncbi:MAG: hypothetical protein JSV18_03285 [Candidatus Bathyarchaeota archaeon]|nr:MAG: hypothetical protein JSV18_03285 [Candidatus Bathyarchaeota archaeon]
MRTETGIRTLELGVALASTYMVAVTLIQTSLYGKLKPWIMKVLGPILAMLGGDTAFLDLVILGLVLALCFTFWRRGDEAGFGRLFSLNMLMFFPAVIDFSMFNWVNLIFPYDPAPKADILWVFGVGLLLQATYLFLRYTVRFRGIRHELTERGAEAADVDEVSKGQMVYLAELVAGTTLISAGVYYGVPFLKDLLWAEASGLPYPHMIIGVACSFLIAAALILYLRSERRKAPADEKIPVEEPESFAIS